MLDFWQGLSSCMIYRFCQLNGGKIDFQDFRTRLNLYSEHFLGVVLSCFVLFGRIMATLASLLSLGSDSLQSTRTEGGFTADH